MRATALAQPRISRKAVAQGVPIPAPVGGWDAISPLANMPIDRAVALDNWIPRPGWIEPRRGSVVHAAGVGLVTDAVETVMAYNGAGVVNKLFAIAGGTIYDATAQGPAVATTVTGQSNSRSQSKMFASGAGTQVLMTVNGADDPQMFDGTSWSVPAITGAGIDPTKFVDVNAHQARMWFVPINSTEAVYLTNIDAFQGAAAFFPLGALMTMGGYIEAIGTWTIDTRQTVDEYIAFITSRGQVIVYAGTDPSTADTWSLVGVYQIGRPIGRRCCLRIAGDLLIICIDGVVGMSEMLSTDRAAANRVSLTSIIMNAMARAAQAYFAVFGWQLIEYPKGTLAILNIPIVENGQQMQFAMNTITGAWCRFPSGIDANCWIVDANDNIYWGGNDGTVYQWDVGSGDPTGDIVCSCETAYNPFGNAAQLKRYTAIQALITTTGQAVPSIGVNVDFQPGSISTSQPVTNPSAQWGTAVWGQFVWAGTPSITNNWTSIEGQGHYVSIVTNVTTKASPGDPSAFVNLQMNGWNITAESGAFV